MKASEMVKELENELDELLQGIKNCEQDWIAMQEQANKEYFELKKEMSEILAYEKISQKYPYWLNRTGCDMQSAKYALRWLTDKFCERSERDLLQFMELVSNIESEDCNDNN